MSQPYSICVYCGSRDGADPAYATAADTLGAAIALEGWRLVYGAGDIGLMGRVARAAQLGGAETFGVIPVHLFEREVGKRDLTTFVVTETMHERKKVMFMNADAIVVMPGGAGSLDEFFETLTWAQLGLHAKPLILLDINGYWKPLTTLMEHVVAQGFAEPGLLRFVQTEPDVGALMDLLRSASASAVA